MLTIAKPIYVEQGSEEWHLLRLGRVTASKFSTVMSKGRGGGEAVGRINYRAELLSERLTGKPVETYKSKEMQWGTDNEPTARLIYQLESGNNVEECGFFAHETLMTGASPDGLVGDDGLLEIKCPNTATHIETLRKNKLPTQYYWQVMGQIWITGRDWCDFVSYDPRLPENSGYFVTRVERNDEDIALLEQEVENFLETVDSEIAFVSSYERASK